MAVSGIADRQRARNGGRLLRLDLGTPRLHGGGNRRAAGRLRAKELHRLCIDQSECNQFIESFLDLGDQRAASHRDDDVIRQPPAQLLGDLEAHSLRAFRVVRTQVDIHEAPAMFVCNLRAEPVHLVVAARDAHDLRAEHLRAEDLRGLEICRNEDPRLEAIARSLRGDGVGKVAS